MTVMLGPHTPQTLGQRHAALTRFLDREATELYLGDELVLSWVKGSALRVHPDSRVRLMTFEYSNPDPAMLQRHMREFGGDVWLASARWTELMRFFGLAAILAMPFGMVRPEIDDLWHRLLKQPTYRHWASARSMGAHRKPVEGTDNYELFYRLYVLVYGPPDPRLWPDPLTASGSTCFYHPLGDDEDIPLPTGSCEEASAPPLGPDWDLRLPALVAA